METKHYEKGNLTIVWKPGICMHSGVCVRGLPGVFKPKEKPWIQPEQASEDAIAAVIDKCPSGALSYIRKDASTNEAPAASATTIEVMKNGPVIISGELILKAGGSESKIEAGRIALCRCGQSSKKPYCDGSHRSASFTAE